jgi:translation initiation factor IF-2
MEGRGVVATLLIQNGTLHCGDNVWCGLSHGKIRDMNTDSGQSINQAGPSTPIEVSGLSEVPDAGEKFYVVDKASTAKTLAEEHKKKLIKGPQAPRIGFGPKIQELLLILKTDVHGSLEALRSKLSELAHCTTEVKLKILHSAVGGINESDVHLAIASKGIIVGFNVTANKAAREIAEEKKLEIRCYNIIYQLLEDVKKMMSGLLIPDNKEEVTGHAVVRKIIKLSKVGNIAGCFVVDGLLERSSKIRISRNGIVLNKEKALTLSSLKHFKDDVNKVKAGFECGLKIDNFDDLKEGDELEAFKIVQVEKTLS